MAENNAKVTLENKEKDKSEILLELKEVLKIEKLPRKIETYDISNISGTNMVAAMCVMQDGVIKKNLSRRFKIKTVFGQDDPRCMEEVITRRLKHSIEDPKGRIWKTTRRNICRRRNNTNKSNKKSNRKIWTRNNQYLEW